MAETAALIASLDLVITVDTGIANLAGTMGKPVWIILNIAPEWLNTHNVTEPAGWGPLLDRLAAALTAIETG